MSAEPRPSRSGSTVPDEVLDDLRRRLAATRWPELVGPDDWTAGAPIDRRAVARRATGATASTGARRNARLNALAAAARADRRLRPARRARPRARPGPAAARAHARLAELDPRVLEGDRPAHRPGGARRRSGRRVRRRRARRCPATRCSRAPDRVGTWPEVPGAVAAADDRRARLPAVRRVRRRHRLDRHHRARRAARGRRRRDPGAGRVRLDRARRSRAGGRRARLPRGARRLGARPRAPTRTSRRRSRGRSRSASPTRPPGCSRGSSRRCAPGRTAAATCCARSRRDELLVTPTLYWAANSIGTSFRPYADTAEVVRSTALPHVEVPVGVAVYPGDRPLPVRAYAERHFNVQRWTVMPRGGHFAALEVPDLWVDETRAFFRPVR